MPEPAAAEDAVAEVDQPELVQVDAERADQKAEPPAERGDDAALARPLALHPLAEEGGGDAQDEDGDGEDPAELGELPVAGDRIWRRRAVAVSGRLKTLSA